ncbi:hypothetical protein B0H13DRAFT_2501596 [Mycena leptocephala]|nr:hypothetical protein B0H13DRAFT_2501596 [Mycena leptocephala]
MLCQHSAQTFGYLWLPDVDQGRPMLTRKNICPGRSLRRQWVRMRCGGRERCVSSRELPGDDKQGPGARGARLRRRCKLAKGRDVPVRKSEKSRVKVVRDGDGAGGDSRGSSGTGWEGEGVEWADMVSDLGNREGVRLVQSVLSPLKVSVREKGKELGCSIGSRFESRLKRNRCGTKTHLPQNSPPSTQPRSLPLVHKLFLSPTVGVLSEQPGQIPYEGTLEVVPRLLSHVVRYQYTEELVCLLGWENRSQHRVERGWIGMDIGKDATRSQCRMVNCSNTADAGVLQESGFSLTRSIGRSGVIGELGPLELSSTSKIVVVAGAPLSPRFPGRKSGTRIQISRSFSRVIGEIGEIEEIGAAIRALKCRQQKSKKALEVDRGWIASGRWAGCEAHSHHHYGAGGDPLDGGARDHNGGKPPRADDG